MNKLSRALFFFLFLAFFINFSYRTNFLEFKSGFLFDLLAPLSTYFKPPLANDRHFDEEIKSLRQDKQKLENDILELKKQLGLKTDYTKTYVMANVIYFDQDQMQIDIGLKAGVVLGDYVVFGNNLIGNISEVEKYKSVVSLLGSTGLRNYCYARRNSSNVWGILTGHSGGEIRLTKIIQEKKLKKGDEVFCDGYFAGRVNRIVSKESDFFYEAVISPALIYENLEHVYVGVGN